MTETPAPATTDDLPEQMRVRREKRDRLLERGTAAYPTAVGRTHTLAEVIERYAPVSYTHLRAH